MLGQSELTILVDPRLPSKIYQGITTEITGEGDSAAPLNDAMLADGRSSYDHLRITPDWRTLRQYFARIEKQGMGINLASYVGATSVRRMVLGDADIQPTPAQIDRMRSLVRDAMRDGAVGLSTALQYTPAPYAKTPELIALAERSRPVRRHLRHPHARRRRRRPRSHRRSRPDRQGSPHPRRNLAPQSRRQGQLGTHARRSSTASISTARKASTSAPIPTPTPPGSTPSPPSSRPGPTTVATPNSFSALEIQQPAPASAKTCSRPIRTPPTWDNEWQEIPGPEAIQIAVVQNPELAPLQGKRLSEVAALWHQDPIDALCDILIKDGAFTVVAVFGMDEPDVLLALKQPWVSIDNDSQGTSPEGLLAQEHPHPRAYGTFPRILRKICSGRQQLTLPDAIRKFTALPAQRMRLTDRGVLKQGMWADVVVFDPATIRDKATFENPNQLSEGMDYVLVNGVPVIDHCKNDGSLAGKSSAWRGIRALIESRL